MPRQTYLSKEFFVPTSEADTRQHILSLPNNVGNIKFVAEDSVKQTMRFLFERPLDNPDNYNCINVSLLPLDVHQTKITLHGSYVHGNVFYDDAEVKNALLNFESAVQAAIRGSISDFKLQQIKSEASYKHLGIIAAVAAIAGIIYLVKSW